MLDKLPENKLKKAIADLKIANVPIYIWGGAKLAQKVKKYLNQNGIYVDGFLINKKYWNKEITELDGSPVYILEDYLCKNKCDLVVAFAGYKEGCLEEYQSNVRQLYVLDFIGVLCMEGFDSSISSDFYIKNKKHWEWLEESLCDERSKNALDEYFFQRLSGKYEKESYDKDQYFPEDIIQLSENEIFLDCGAYHGESALDFIRHVQKRGIHDYEKVICVEADKKNFERLMAALNRYKNIEFLSVGVWDKDGNLYINAGHGETSQVSPDGNEKISVRTIDSILENKRVSYIKMDIEGSELKALRGAEKTILKYKPKLSICVYHKPEDLVEIPKYIYKLRNDYKFYIRNHSLYGVETVLYAI